MKDARAFAHECIELLDQVKGGAKSNASTPVVGSPSSCETTAPKASAAPPKQGNLAGFGSIKQPQTQGRAFASAEDFAQWLTSNAEGRPEQTDKPTAAMTGVAESNQARALDLSAGAPAHGVQNAPAGASGLEDPEARRNSSASVATNQVWLLLRQLKLLLCAWRFSSVWWN